MPGLLVHVGALATCFHGGTVSALVPNPRVFASGAPVLAITNVPTVAGCPFQVPVPGGTKLQPCVKIVLQSASRVFIGGQPAAILPGIGQSIEQIPQGAPNSMPIQKRVTAS